LGLALPVETVGLSKAAGDSHNGQGVVFHGKGKDRGKG
jgi:hypothetical protein